MRYLTALLTAILLTACVVSDATREEKERHLELRDRPTHVENALLEDRVVRGMTRTEVKMVLGRPYTINKSNYRGDRKVQWCYQKAGGRCFYFENEENHYKLTLTGWN